MIDKEVELYQKLAMDEQDYKDWQWMLKINERLNKPRKEVQDGEDTERNPDTP